MNDALEQGQSLTPRWDAAGLVTAVVSDASTGEILLLAHMNQEALQRSIDSNEAHFWSRSRQSLWKKGESSGNVLRIVEMRIDCDQDAIWIKADPAGPACHTGERSCFYRRIDGNRLVRDS